MPTQRDITLHSETMESQRQPVPDDTPALERGHILGNTRRLQEETGDPDSQ